MKKNAVLRPRTGVRERRRADALRAAAGAAGLAATAALASPDRVSAIERDVFEALNTPWTAGDAPLWAVTQAGSFAAVFVTAGLALVARRPALATVLATGGTATWLLAKAVKVAVDRGRPAALLQDVVIHGTPATGLGFPSGHAAVAACLMTVASPYLTRPARVVGRSAVLVVAFARVFVGAHLPLDAAGGLLLGLAVGSLTNLAFGVPSR
jgi:glycosyltransferase 2 family protein